MLPTENLTLDKAKPILEAVEASSNWMDEANSLKFQSNSVKVKAEVNFNQSAAKVKKPSFKNADDYESKASCTRCGSYKHTHYDNPCLTRNAVCNKCNLKGLFAKMCKTKSSRIAAMKAGKSSEKPQCNEVKGINGVYVPGNIVDTHNVFSVETVSM